MSKHQSSVPAAAASYFGAGAEHPVVVQVFGTRWRRYPVRKRVSLSWARRARRSGVTAVALRSGGRTADFRIQELTH